jgi:hypothetical protein
VARLDRDRRYSIDLNGTPTAAHPSPVGSISQTFATTPGLEYQVSFSYADNPVCGPSTKGMTVSVNGSVLRHYSFSTAATTMSNMGWTYDLYNFWIADASGTTTLTFTADPSNTSNCGFVIAGVYAGTPEAGPPPGSFEIRRVPARACRDRVHPIPAGPHVRA